jgi:hypothetical protein
MKIRTVTSIQEDNLDRYETCEHCGQRYKVIQRAYGTSQCTEDLLVPNPGAAQKGAETGAAKMRLKEKSGLLPYHRCTECGFYGRVSLEQMKSVGYQMYLKRSREAWRSILFLLLISVASLGYSILGHEAGFFRFVTITFSVLLGLMAIAARPKSKEVWDAKADHVNSPEIVAQWLKKWNEKLAGDMRERVRDMDI